MVSVRIKHLRRVRAKGRTYWYHRKTGERLPDDEAARLRRVLDINDGLEKPGRRVRVGSVEAIANIYRGSPTFKRLATRTQQDYGLRLRVLCDLWGDHVALRTSNEQRGTLDLPICRQPLLGVHLEHGVLRVQPSPRVEFPDPLAVGSLLHSTTQAVTQLLDWSEWIESVGRLHEVLERVLGLRSRVKWGSILPLRRHGSERDVHQHQTFYSIGMFERVIQRVYATHRKANQNELADAEMFHPAGNVLQMVLSPVLSIGRPIAVTVSSLIKRVDVIAIPHHLGELVPAMRILTAAVQQQHRFVSRCTPVEVMEVEVTDLRLFVQPSALLRHSSYPFASSF